MNICYQEVKKSPNLVTLSGSAIHFREMRPLLMMRRRPTYLDTYFVDLSFTSSQKVPQQASTDVTSTMKL